MRYFIKRTFAYLIDCTICYSLVMILIQWVILSQLREKIGITEEWFENSLNMELYVLVSISFPVWLYFTLLDSKIAKGSPGKRLLKLSLVEQNDSQQRISVGKSFLRTILKLLPWEIIHLGIIFPVPLYFVEEPEFRLVSIIGILLFISYALSIFLKRSKQTLYDMLIKTQVIEK